MNRTKIIEHYKKFMELDKMQEDYQIDIDWMEAFIEDNNLVNKNDLLPVVSGSCTDGKHRRQITEKELKLAAKEVRLEWGLIEYLINKVRKMQVNSGNYR